MSANFEKKQDHIHEPQVLRLEGVLDAQHAEKLSETIDSFIERGLLLIALDFMRVDMVSSAAIRVLIEKTTLLDSQEGKLVLFSVHEDVYEMLKLAGFEKILHIFPIEGEALSALNT
jgi:anti-anti-sigma factor